MDLTEHIEFLGLNHNPFLGLLITVRVLDLLYQCGNWTETRRIEFFSLYLRFRRHTSICSLCRPATVAVKSAPVIVAPSVSLHKEDWDMQRASWLDRHSLTHAPERSLHLIFSSYWRFECILRKNVFYHLPQPPPPLPSPATLEDHCCARYSKRPHTIYLCSETAEVARQAVASYYGRRQKKNQKNGPIASKRLCHFLTEVADIVRRRAQRWQKCWCAWRNKRGGDTGNEVRSFRAQRGLFVKDNTNEKNWKKTNRQLVFFLFLSNAIMQLDLSVNLVLCLLFSFTSCDIRVKAENYFR